jgi:hypothetical protein
VLKQLQISALFLRSAGWGSGERIMRKLLLSVALAVMALPLSGPASALEGPWCAVLNFGGMGPAEKCDMPSFEVCRELAMQYGTASFCRQNPGWPGYRQQGPQERSAAHRKKRRHHH